MNEWVDRAINGRIERIEMRQVRKGDRYRVCTPSFEGPWRIAAADAALTRSTWTVADVRKGRVERHGALKIYSDNEPKTYLPDPPSKTRAAVRQVTPGAYAGHQLVRIEHKTFTYKELAQRYNRTDSEVRLAIKRSRSRSSGLTWANLEHFLKRETA